MASWSRNRTKVVCKSDLINKHSTCHTGLEALPSQKKVSVHGTGVPVFLRPVWYWDGVAKPEKMGKKFNSVIKLVQNT